MAKRFKRAFLERLFESANIVDVISSDRQVQRRGSDSYVCICPFHNDKSPSLSITPSKGLYHCFSCSASGNSLTYLKNRYNLSFYEAVEKLAGIMGVSMEFEESNFTPDQIKAEQERLQQLEQDRSVMTKVSELYQDMLQKTPQALDYLKSRNISSEMVELYRIGFAPGNNFIRLFLEQNPAYFGITKEAAKQCLLNIDILRIQEGKLTSYDTYSQRIMFPIVNERSGQILGFGGRTIVDHPAKYINPSNESSLYNKSAEVYGLYQADYMHKKLKQKLERLILVEGYLDVISLSQFGLYQGVAASGTAIQPQQVRKIFNFTKNLAVCFDGDSAGYQAAYKSLAAILSTIDDEKNITFSFLPQPEDPDSYLKKFGVEAFEKFISQGQDLVAYIIEHEYEATKVNGVFTPQSEREFRRLITQHYSYLLRPQRPEQTKDYRRALIRSLAHKLQQSVADVSFEIESDAELEYQKREEEKRREREWEAKQQTTARPTYTHRQENPSYQRYNSNPINSYRSSNSNFAPSAHQQSQRNFSANPGTSPAPQASADNRANFSNNNYYHRNHSTQSQQGFTNNKFAETKPNPHGFSHNHATSNPWQKSPPNHEFTASVSTNGLLTSSPLGASNNSGVGFNWNNGGNAHSNPANPGGNGDKAPSPTGFGGSNSFVSNNLSGSTQNYPVAQDNPELSVNQQLEAEVEQYYAQFAAEQPVEIQTYWQAPSSESSYAPESKQTNASSTSSYQARYQEAGSAAARQPGYRKTSGFTGTYPKRNKKSEPKVRDLSRVKLSTTGMGATPAAKLLQAMKQQEAAVSEEQETKKKKVSYLASQILKKELGVNMPRVHNRQYGPSLETSLASYQATNQGAGFSSFNAEESADSEASQLVTAVNQVGSFGTPLSEIGSSGTLATKPESGVTAVADNPCNANSATPTIAENNPPLTSNSFSSNATASSRDLEAAFASATILTPANSNLPAGTESLGSEGVPSIVNSTSGFGTEATSAFALEADNSAEPSLVARLAQYESERADRSTNFAISLKQHTRTNYDSFIFHGVRLDLTLLYGEQLARRYYARNIIEYHTSLINAENALSKLLILAYQYPQQLQYYRLLELNFDVELEVFQLTLKLGLFIREAWLELRRNSQASEDHDRLQYQRLFEQEFYAKNRAIIDKFLTLEQIKNSYVQAQEVSFSLLIQVYVKLVFASLDLVQNYLTIFQQDFNSVINELRFVKFYKKYLTLQIKPANNRNLLSKNLKESENQLYTRYLTTYQQQRYRRYFYQLSLTKPATDVPDLYAELKAQQVAQPKK